MSASRGGLMRTVGASRLKDYALATFAGIWLADGMALLVAPPRHHHPGPGVGAAVPCDIAVGASRDHRRHHHASSPRRNSSTNRSGS